MPLLLVFAGKEMVKVIRNYGYGLAILFAGVGFMSLGSESRQLINFYPLFGVLALVALQSKQMLKPWVLVVLGLSSLILSRFWYTINGAGDIGKNLLQFPAQRYFQVFGPWMSNETFMTNFVICIMAFGSLFLLNKTGQLFDPVELKIVLQTKASKKRK